MKDEPLRWGRLVLLYPCALSKILGFLWLRIIKNGIEKADIAAGWFQALCNSVPNLCNMKRIWFKRCSLGLEMPYI